MTSGLLDETMQRPAEYDALEYSYISLLVIGILGNLSVIISIARQRRSLLKSNYYFLVMHLAICDMGALIVLVWDYVDSRWIKEPSYSYSKVYCILSTLLFYVFVFGGVFIMLVISMARFRATVHPLKPAITRRKLAMVCSIPYVASSVFGSTAVVFTCYMPSQNANSKIFFPVISTFFVYFIPIIFMAVVYYKIARALARQKQNMNRLCASAVSCRYIRDRRIFFVCISTVLCYAVGRLPETVRYILIISGKIHLLVRHPWITPLCFVVDVVGTHLANLLIYGVLDKKLLPILKICKKRT